MDKIVFLIRYREDFPGVPVVKTELPLQGARVRSLVGELRSHMPQGVAKKSKLKKEK